MLLMIDNYDSFTYNVVQYFTELGAEVKVVRNDEITLEEIEALNPERLVISPGPCTPNEAGISMDAIRHFSGKLPILGICLGHQALIQHYGGVIARAPEVVHGKSSDISHNNLGAFKNIANPLPVARYHSLVASEMPEQLTMTAQVSLTINNEDIVLPMAVEHSKDAAIGFQFHPESILTTFGTNLLAQSLSHLSNLADQTIYKVQGHAHDNH